MNQVPQLASAMLALAFAAVMLVAGQLFIEYRSTSNAFKTGSRKDCGDAALTSLSLHILLPLELSWLSRVISVVGAAETRFRLAVRRFVSRPRAGPCQHEEYRYRY